MRIVCKARRDVDAHLLLPLEVARNATGKVRPGGTLLFMGGTGGRSTAPGLSLISALTVAAPVLTRNLNTTQPRQPESRNATPPNRGYCAVSTEPGELQLGHQPPVSRTNLLGSYNYCSWPRIAPPVNAVVW
jgi:hypothetical protein